MPENVNGTTLSDKLKEIVDRRFRNHSGAPSCPSCGSSEVTRYGKTAAGTQRWRCSDCGSVRTSAVTGRILANTKLDYATWSAFIPLFIDRVSCDKVAETLGVCHKTAWFMRIRMLEAAFEELPSFRIDDCSEVRFDRMHFRESFKGHRRESTTGKGAGVLTAVNDDGDFFYDVSCRGKVTAGHAGASVINRIRSGAITAADGSEPSEKAFARIMASIPGIDNKESQNNGIRSRIRSFMTPFHGVSTRWLHMYMAWFKWSFSFGNSIITGLSQMTVGNYIHTWAEIQS